MRRVLLAVVLLLGLAVLPAAAQQPDDRYVKVLANHKLEEGKGFVGVLPLGMGVPDMIKALGYPAEHEGKPLWYFYEKGPWTLTVVTRFDKEASLVRVRALMVTGAGAPQTAAGVRIGDTVDAVEKAYGKGQRDGETLLYPARGVAFLLQDEKVVKILVNAP